MFPNVTADTYTVEVTMEGFKTLTRKGVRVSGGDRVAVPTMTIEVGGATETVNVAAEAAIVQSQSGERSFAVDTELVAEPADQPRELRQPRSESRPAPSAAVRRRAATRLGGVSQNNIMMDGVSAMDTGNNGQMLNMNIESIGEVKILTQGYQAEFGRSSGLQITAVTKSGTNQFRGSAYDIQTDSDWNANSWVRDHNGDAKPKTDQKVLGYTIGGPVGKPGATNKLFFFYAHEYRPTTAAINGGAAIRLRVPTLLERSGDFSQSLDNNGDPIPQLLDPLTRAPIPGNKIPADKLYWARADDPQPVPRSHPHASQGNQLQLRNPEQRDPDDGRSDPAARYPARLPDELEAAVYRQVLRSAGAKARYPWADSGIH